MKPRTNIGITQPQLMKQLVAVDPKAETIS
jgi:hypothetical protein